MLPSKTVLLCCITLLLNLITTTAQRITSDLAEGFEYVSVRGENPIFYLVEDQRYAIVTEGIPLESLHFKIEKGILTIHMPKEGCHEKKSLVLLYPRGNQVPKVINTSGDGLVRL
ncbi:MAG: hypothetical protein AAF634_17385 [Bacteroidota bacterium]